MPFENGITTREESYWWGFLIGDGNLARGRNRISLAAGQQDMPHFLRMKEFIGMGRIIPFPERCVTYIVENKVLTNNLRAIGLEPAKTYTIDKKLTPTNYPADFYRGLFDSDGSLFVRDNHCILRWNGTMSMMEGIKGHFDNKIEKSPNVWKDRNIYCWGVHSRFKAEIIGKEIWNNPTICLDRKYELVKKLYEINEQHPVQGHTLDISNIKESRQNGISLKEVAEKHHISVSHVSRIANGQRYKHLNSR
jgi:hypothetical protein